MNMSEIMTHTHLSKDRVQVSLTRKFNVAQYESLDIHVGLSSDRQEDETLQQAWARTEKSVYTEFMRLVGLYEGGKLKA